jgi:hypothetical protein
VAPFCKMNCSNSSFDIGRCRQAAVIPTSLT